MPRPYDPPARHRDQPLIPDREHGMMRATHYAARVV
jgi:hypothetical protein